jgi:hypothetical protein
MTTIYPQYAIDSAATKVKKIPLDEVAVSIVNDITQQIWVAGNWKWSLGDISVNTTPPSDAQSQKEYDLTSNLTDCARFVQGRLIIPDRGVHGEIRNESVRELEPTGYIPNNTIYGQPSQFQYIPGTVDKIRFNTYFSHEGSLFHGIYKKNVPVFTTNKDLFSVTLVTLPDEWFWVFQEGVLWKVYAYANDQRAGNVQFQEGRVSYSGQAAVFQAALGEMLRKEPLIITGYREVVENVK